jgi:hypothetical protein
MVTSTYNDYNDGILIIKTRDHKSDGDLTSIAGIVFWDISGPHGLFNPQILLWAKKMGWNKAASH